MHVSLLLQFVVGLTQKWHRLTGLLATTSSNQQNPLYWPIMAHQVLKLLHQKPQQCGAIKTVEFI